MSNLKSANAKPEKRLEDSQAFVESLLNPPDPNTRMMEAALQYKRSLGN
jgi:hypothetical protein